MTNKRQQKETPDAIAAYEWYRSMPSHTRSLKLLSEQLASDSDWQDDGKARVRLATLEKWSTSFGWQERLKVDDKARALQKIEARQQTIDEMNERHAKLAVDTLEQAMRVVNIRLTADDFGTQALVMLIDKMLATERQARGDIAKLAIELTGKDGGKIEVDQQVLFYLPDQETIPDYEDD